MGFLERGFATHHLTHPCTEIGYPTVAFPVPAQRLYAVVGSGSGGAGPLSMWEA